MRVAVISTSMHDDVNLLWRATEGLIDEQLIIGPGSTAQSGTVSFPVRPLADRDLGRGLIWQHLRHLRQELRRFKPDLVHLNGELWGVRALQVVAANCAFVVHGAENIWSHGYPIERVIRDQLVPRVLARSRGYASWNVQGAQHAARVVGDKNFPTCVVAPVIPPNPFRETDWRQPEGPQIRVLLVGRLERQKGFHLVLEAVSWWAGAISVTICGDGPEREALAKQAAHLGVSVDFVGQVQSVTLARLMARHSILIQPSITTPSWMEQFGRSVAEAICVGIPVLTSRSGELPNVMGGQSAWTFDQDSVPAVRAALAALVDQPRTKLTELSQAQGYLRGQVAPENAASRIVEFWHQAKEYQPLVRRS
jgi:glycosyltransferase involved in cell wall biosynthesis